ncbi:MAG: sulfatase-like hydrolase/transferase [Flavobacteriales bacterium]|nr:sulfatase-like hydrolase/transferase [Flavobacteriales bacterium]
MMYKKALKILVYFLFWVVFFLLGKILFFIITGSTAIKHSFTDLAASLIHGLWLDLSIAGYFTLIFCVLNSLTVYVPKIRSHVINGLNLFLLFTASLAVVSNAVLYTYWSVPLDFNALRYLENPQEAEASINWVKMIWPLLLGAVLFWLGFRFVKKMKLIATSEKKLKDRLGSSALYLMFASLCIIPIRGGIGIVPVNLSFVYFHNQIYPNHAAYNPIWNVLYTFLQNDESISFNYMEKEKADKIFKRFYPEHKAIHSDLLKKGVDKPNVLILVLEGFLDKLVHESYQDEKVCPYLNRLSENSIYFSNFYSSGDRSDKGLASIFSGFPALPKVSVLQYPEVFNSMPSLFKDFNSEGYTSRFYYGGDLDFANLKSYFLSLGVKGMVSEKDMPTDLPRGKWGVHDEFMFNKLSSDLTKVRTPFFEALFTLSNHEPYDIPEKHYFGRSGVDEEYMSAARYTDRCVQRFMESFKKSKHWDNTLVIILSDHGVGRFDYDLIYHPEKYHVPMMWTGGMIEKTAVVNTIFSHTDLPYLILDELHMKALKEYEFSRSLDRSAKDEGAIYLYNDGIGVITKNCISVYDNIAQKYMEPYVCSDSVSMFGKAMLQKVGERLRSKNVR